jgi:hypothetical protein
LGGYAPNYAGGRWEFTNYALPRLNLYNFTVLIEYVSDTLVVYDRYAGLVVKKTFCGNIVFDANVPNDPDGAPVRPRFKSVDKLQ